MTIQVKQKIVNEVPRYIPYVMKSKQNHSYMGLRCAQVHFRYLAINFVIDILLSPDGKKNEYFETVDEHSDAFSVNNKYKIDGVDYTIEKITHTSPLDYTIFLEDRKVTPVDMDELIENEKQKALDFIEKWKSENSSLLKKIKLIWEYN